MAEIATFLNDPRKRSLIALAVIALGCVLFAVVALWLQAERLAPKYTPELFFPQLEEKQNEIARIRVVTKKNGILDIVKVRDKVWVMPERNNYPASAHQAETTIIALLNLERLEPKTSRSSWLDRVGLSDPAKGGSGVLVALLDGKGKTIASLIAGKSEDIGDPTGAIGLFAREPDSNQAWLARSVVELSGDPSVWVDKNVLNIDRSQIQETDVTPASGPAYVARRDKPSDAEFTLATLPKGREVADPSAASGVAAAIVNFTFDDVKTASSFDFSKPTRLVTKTFDGLTITTSVIQQGQDNWAQISAEAAPGKPDAAKEAKEINTRAGGWAYKLPADKGQLFMTPLESLLKPIAAPKK
ncbi:MAG: DUF4340 domain-containing protein [Proteobacteria bacterium]|nr:DUF4340 domain-containing protein [Pseudomonadota bacterium]